MVNPIMIQMKNLLFDASFLLERLVLPAVYEDVDAGVGDEEEVGDECQHLSNTQYSQMLKEEK